MNGAANERQELNDKCLPNIRIHNLVVNMTEETEEFCLIHCRASGKKVSLIGLSNIYIDGLTINPYKEMPVNRMTLSNIEIGTRTPVDCQIKNVVVNLSLIKGLFGNIRPNVQLKTNLTVKGGKVQLKNATGIVQ